jgi:hypothetical protein
MNQWSFVWTDGRVFTGSEQTVLEYAAGAWMHHGPDCGDIYPPREAESEEIGA